MAKKIKAKTYTKGNHGNHSGSKGRTPIVKARLAGGNGESSKPATEKATGEAKKPQSCTACG